MVSQVDSVMKKEFGMLVFLGKGIAYKGWGIMMQLHKSMVRPQLEYCGQIWLPSYRRNDIKLESVHQNAYGLEL